MTNEAVRPPSLDDLRAFETVARLGSVRAAAIELSLTHGAVSRRVSKLGNDLRLALLEPHGRGVRPTPAGAGLAEATTRAFQIITDRLAEIRSAARPDPVVLSCERSLAMRWLIPRLSAFQDHHPGIEVHLSTGGGRVEFAREGISLAIRRLDFAIDPGWIVEDLAPERVGPVVVPALAERFASGDYVALASRTRPEAWSDWLERNPDCPPPRSTRMLDHHFLMVEAALGGLGVALAPQLLAQADVAQGRLTAPLGFQADGTRYALIRQSGQPPSEAVAALSHWLHREAEAPG